MKKRYHYTESGLPNVWLANGYTVRKTRYGEAVSIRDVEGLHRAIGRALANRPGLTGSEIRFLRKEMGLSQKCLGELLGVTDQAVALWERNRGKLPKTADINTDLQNHELIVAEETKGKWTTRLAA